MNQQNQYIFGLYQFLLNVRDTLEYTLEREHNLNVFEERKRVIQGNLQDENSVFGNFVKNNKEQTEKLVEKLKEFFEDFYEGGSTVLTPAGDKVRVDHSQNIKIFEETIQISESIRDVLYAYINYSKSRNELDADIEELVKTDEKLYRAIVNMLVMREFQKSFSEFQKVMSESKGQQTPQSNFIVQNELVKLSSLIRFSRQHAHCTDNETLDMLDKAITVIEMSEGRRDRRDGKSFKTLFDEINAEANASVGKNENNWKTVFERVRNDVIASQQQANKKSDA